MATTLCAAFLKIKSEVSTMTTQNCVAYMRYSTDNQNENSIEYQRAEIEKYCTQNRLTLLHEYVDQAFSATNDRRPDFRRMMADAQSDPDWDVILVYDLSRIFRNVKDAARYRAVLSDSSIHLVSVTEPLPDSDEGWLTGTLKDTLNEYYSRQTKRKTHAGMAVNASKAGHCGGIPPLGYDVGADGKLTINEAEAETVREIFQLYNLGYSLKNMANFLNDNGLQTKAGRPFTKNSFNNILTQEKYIGVYRWNKRKAKDSKGRHNNHAYKPAEEQIVIPGGCPAILPLEVFQEAQEKLSQRKRGRADTKSRHHYMLGGMKRLKCANCGSYMTGKVTTSHGKKYLTYTCPNHKGGSCPTKDIPAKNLEQYAAAVIVKEFQIKNNLPQLNQCLKTGGNNAEAQQLRNRLKGTEKKIGNITRSLENGCSEALTNRLQLLEQEKLSLMNQLQETNQPVPDVTEKNLKNVWNKLIKVLSTSNDPDVKQLLMACIREITVSNDSVNVTLQI